MPGTEERAPRHRQAATLSGLAVGAASVVIAASIFRSAGSQPRQSTAPYPGSPTVAAALPGMDAAFGEAVPEGRLVVQLNSGIEVLPRGADRSVSLGGGRLFGYGVSTDGSKVLAATYVTEPTHYTREDQLLGIDTSTGEQMVLVRAGPTEDLGPAAWSPVGESVAYRLSVLGVDPAKEHPGESTEQTVCIVSVATRASRCLPDLRTVDGFAWSPDGRQMVVDGVGADLPLRLLQVASGDVSDFASPHDPDLVAALGGNPPPSFVLVDWSPSGTYVATHTQRAAAIFDADGRFVTVGHATQEFSEVFTWSPTQDLLAYAIGRPPYAITDLFLLDPATGQDRPVYSTGQGDRAPIIIDAAWSPSGRWIAVATAERTPFLEKAVHIIDVTGGGSPSVVRLGPADGADVLVGWGP